jgi:hypothetical protein
MSKKSVVRGVRGWKLAAVATLVVAGVVGLVWAALPNISSGKSDSMGVGFQVITKAEIECVGKNPDQEILKVTDVAVAKIQNPGNLGYVKVTTNSNGWDVWMTSANGGRLRYNVGGTPDSNCLAHTDLWNPSLCTSWSPPFMSGGTDEFLTYSTDGTTTAAGLIEGTSGDYDTVQLEVAIGVAYLGSQLNASAAQGDLYSIGAPTNATLAVPYKVIFGELEKTATVYGTNPAASTAAVPVKFAPKLGAYYATLTPPSPYDTLAGRLWTHASNVCIEKDGFAAPRHGLNGPAEEQYFFVNVGINQGLVDAIGGNKEGIYTETFTFELAANF